MASPSKPSPRRESTAPAVPMAHSPPLRRNKSVRGFLPVTEEPFFSTRGQNLPQLLSHLGVGTGLSSRRSSSFALPPGDEPDLEAGTVRGDDRRGGRDASDSGLGAREGGELEGTDNGTTEETSGTKGLWPLGKTQDGPVLRRLSDAAKLLMTPEMRSMRLIGNNNPRYNWEKYFKSDEELRSMKKPIRKYYERNNYLIQQYVYIDRLLDSSLPHNLIQEYNMQSYGYAPDTSIHVPDTISEEFRRNDSLASHTSSNGGTPQSGNTMTQGTRIERTPRNLYKLPDERTPLICVQDEDDDEDSQQNVMPPWTPEEEADSNDRIVTVAIYLNLAANTILLVLKVVAMVLTSSVSVLAALVDAVLDFLSTAIVWTTTRLISTEDQYKYPVGRRRLEPIGVLVFSVIMITSFFQVALEGFNRLSHGEHVAVSLGPAAILIMAGTVVIKGACWIWCRLIKNSSVQALAQDAQTDVVFNTFSIIFPLVGYYADIWFLDSLGGILLSVYVIYAWSRTTAVHVCNLSGAAATADERNVLLYLTMRFAKTIKHIQGLQAYHAGDKLNVEVDIVVDGNMRLRDSHDLGESLQYVLESVPTVDRAFVHMDYTAFNLPTHMRQ